MASVKLVFGRPPLPTPGPVRLVFGEEGSAPAIPDATLHGAGQITGLRLRVALRTGAMVQATGSITGLRLRVAAKYNINVTRPTVAPTLAVWTPADLLQNGVQHATQDPTATPAGAAPGWQRATPTPASTAAAFAVTTSTPISGRAAFENATRALQDAQALHSNARRDVRNLLHTAFENAARAQTQPTAQRHQDAYRDRRAWRATGWQVARPMPPKRTTSGQGPALPLAVIFAGDYQNAMRPPPGIYVRPPVPGPAPCYLPALPAHLVFTGPHDATLPARLTFVCERGDGPGPEPEPVETVVVPIRRVYVTINSIILTRVSDGMPLPADGFGMSIDTDSWTWQWSASMQPAMRQYLTPVAGEPVAVQAVVNGVPYRLCAESISSDRSFGSARINVRGRGLGAVLDAPYAPTLNFGNPLASRTAQQLMADVLTINGVGIGWGVEFGLTDWLVPAGAWSHQGHYMSAITAIAAAAGGYVQPHATLQTLRILPRYPVGPWAWAAVAPDFELPADVVSIEGIEWTTKPAYNRVHVSGVAQGVLAEATRAGTAGGIVAPMVTDPLITHADAARQRALAVLADTGAQARVTLTLPVLAETGLILPGKFVRYSDGPVQRSGIVRATSLAWSRPTLRQTLQLETHGSD